MNRSRKRREGGFSVVEALIVIASIGVLSTIALSFVGDFRSGAERTKLESAVQTVNSAISVYLANGGDLTGITNPQTIIDSMKFELSDSVRKQTAGITGTTIDRRLAVRIGEAVEGEPVVTWSSSSQKFEISEDGGSGVLEFVLDDTLAEKDYSSGNRDTTVLTYNESPGWVWAYTESTPAPPDGPTTIPLASVPDTAPRPPPVKLSTPIISIPSGSFDSDEFPFSVTLTNPNVSSTWIMYSINGGAFEKYDGNPLSVTGAASIMAYADGHPYYWVKSGKTYSTFTETPPPPPVPLVEPVIVLTSNVFTEDITEIAVAISNVNPSGSSSLFYSLVSTGTSHSAQNLWSKYTGPLSTASADYPDGFQVAAYAKSNDPVKYIDSAAASALASVQFFEIPISGDVLFIVDASGSMSRSFGDSTRFEVTIETLKEAIQSLPVSIKFNVAMFDAGVHWTDGSNTLKPANKSNKDSVIAGIDSVSHGSGTSYLAALSVVDLFSPLPEQVILLSDGQPNDTGYLERSAALAAKGVRIDTIGLDFDTGYESPLAEIAKLAGGQYIAIEGE